METQSSIADSLENLFYDLANPNVDYGSLRYGFSIGNLNFIYANNIASEVIKSVVIYSVPNTPSWMLGLINLRGSLVPVFDLEKYFEVKNNSADANKLLLVLGTGEKAVAFQLRKYPELLNNLTKLDGLLKLIPKIDGYVIAAYQGQEEKIWLELDKEKFFSTLGEKVCL